MSKKQKDLSNEKNFNLTFVKAIGTLKCECICYCGKKTIMTKNNFLKKRTFNCNECFGTGIRGLNKNDYKKIKKIFYNIKQRCYNKNNFNYKNYGLLGVKICNEWIENPISFYKWCLENGYKNGYELDKDKKCRELGINPHIYSPNTCTFVSKKENLNNKKVNRILEYNVEKLNVTEWSEKLNIKRETIYYRIKRGFSIEKILQQK